MGLEVHCFAWESGSVCKDVADFFYPISVIDKEEILKQCQKAGIDGITTIASDVAVVTVNYVASRMGLVSNPDQYTPVTTNKYRMRSCFRENGIPSPGFLLASAQDNLQVSGLEYPLIVKPTDRSGSKGVEKVTDPSMLSQAVKRACADSFEHKAIIEEFVTGSEISVESISFKGRHHILQITDKVTTGEPFFVELEHHQPSALPESIKERVKAIVLKALDALHIQYGASHSELKITGDGDIRVIEIGARMGGDFIGSNLVQLSTGYDFVKGVIEVALGTFSEPVITRRAYSGVYFLCKETEWLRDYILHPERLQGVQEADITDPELRNVQCSADRSGYLIYQSQNSKLVLP